MRSLLAATVLTLSALTAGCEEDSKRAPMPPTTTAVCEPDEDDGYFLRSAFLRGATYYTCRRPADGDSGLAFTEHTGIPVTVTGGSLVLDLEWRGGSSIAGRTILMGMKSSRGHWRTASATDDNPLRVELYMERDAPSGDRILWFAFDDGTGTSESPSVGPIYEIPVDIINVGSGDVQVSLSWDTPTDVDLHVTDPTGEEVFFAHKLATSGGSLDLDSNAGCSIDNVNNENIFWPTDAAPRGDYLVRVHMWSDCGTYAQNVTTNFRLTVAQGNGDIELFEDAFEPNSEEMREVVTFTW